MNNNELINNKLMNNHKHSFFGRLTWIPVISGSYDIFFLEIDTESVSAVRLLNTIFFIINLINCANFSRSLFLPSQRLRIYIISVIPYIRSGKNLFLLSLKYVHLKR